MRLATPEDYIPFSWKVGSQTRNIYPRAKKESAFVADVRSTSNNTVYLKYME
jgi:hypothetical protein